MSDTPPRPPAPPPAPDRRFGPIEDYDDLYGDNDELLEPIDLDEQIARFRQRAAGEIADGAGADS